MQLVTSGLLAASSLLLGSQLPVVNAQDSNLNAITYKGCYSSSTGLQDQGSYTFQTSGYCQSKCAPLNKPVMGLSGGNHCWCGTELPPQSAKVSDGDCNTPCQGYPKDKCGGSSRFTVYLTGTSDNVGSASGGGNNNNNNNNGGNSNSNSNSNNNNNNNDQNKKPPPPSPTKATPVHPVTSIITLGGQTQTVTRENSTPTGSAAAQSGKPSAAPSKGSSPGRTAGIAAGVVVGVVLLGAAIGGGFLFLRNKKRRAIEEEYRRNAAATSFRNGKPGSESSLADSRLEPSVMMQRRMSDMSIADNQDYSRRILKVTNPDRS